MVVQDPLAAWREAKAQRPEEEESPLEAWRRARAAPGPTGPTGPTAGEAPPARFPGEAAWQAALAGQTTLDPRTGEVRNPSPAARKMRRVAPGEVLKQATSSFVGNLAEIPAGFLDAVALGADWLGQKTGIDQRPADERATHKYAEAIRDLARQLAPPSDDPALRESFWASKLPGALGSGLGFIAGTGPASLMGKAATRMGAAVLGGGVNAQAQFWEAMAETEGDTEKAYEAFLKGLGAGATEAVGVGAILAKIDQRSGGLLRRALAGALREGAEEAGQEGVQTVLNNLIAQSTYDEEREALAGALESAGLGLAAGSVFGGLFNAALGDQRGLGPMLPAQEGAAVAEAGTPVSEAQEGVDPAGEAQEGAAVAPIDLTGQTEASFAEQQETAEAERAAEGELELPGEAPVEAPAEAEPPPVEGLTPQQKEWRQRGELDLVAPEYTLRSLEETEAPALEETAPEAAAAQPAEALVPAEQAQPAPVEPAFQPAPDVEESEPGAPASTVRRYVKQDSSHRQRGELSGAAYHLPEESRFRWVQRIFQDKFARPKVVTEAVREQGGEITEESDVVLAEKLLYGRSHERAQQAEAEVVDPIVKLLGRHKISREEADYYIRNWSAPERNDVIYARNAERDPEDSPGSGIKTSVAEQETAKLEAGPKGEGYRQLAEAFQALTAENVRIREEAGLIDADEAEAWRSTYTRYAPFRTADLPGAVRGGRRGIRGAESKRAEGRATLADSPLNFARVQLHEAISRAEQNRVFQAMAEFVHANPDPQLWGVRELPSEQALVDEDGEPYFGERIDPALKIDENRAVAFKVDGKRHVIEFADPLMARALTGSGVYHGGAITQFLAPAMRALSAMQTSLDPEFIARNLVRDLQTAGVHLSGEQSAAVAREMVKTLPRAWRGILDELFPKLTKAVPGKKAATEWRQNYRDFRRLGGQTGWFYAPTFEQSLKSLERLVKDENPGAGRWTVLQAHKFFDLVMDVNSIVEQGTRLSAFQALRPLIGDQRAAAAGRELTVDFNRAGEIGNALNVWYLFYKAGANGSARVMAALRNPRVRKIALGITAFGAARALINRMIGGVDEDDQLPFWDKIPQYERERNSILMLPPGSVPDKMFKGALAPLLGRVPGEGGGVYLKLPSPWGYNVFDYIGQRIVDVLPQDVGGAGDKPAEAVKDMTLAVLEAFNPMGTAPSLLQLGAPTMLDPYVQLETNETFYGAPLYPERMGPWDKRPESQLSWRSTPKHYKEAAEWLNDITGGSEFRSGALDVSPEAIEHWVGFLTGGVGRTVKRSQELAVGLVTDEPREVRQVPFLRSFAGEPADYVVQGLYYDNRDQAEQIEFEIRGHKKAGERSLAHGIERANRRTLRMLDEAERIQGLLKKGRLSETEKIKQMKIFNRRFRRAREMDRRGDG